MASVVTFGEILMRLSPLGDERISQCRTMDVHYGGSEANISAALAQWNVSAAHATVLPRNQIGDAALSFFRSAAVDVTHIQSAAGRMGQYILEPGVSLRSPSIIYDRADSCFANLLASQFDWEKILHDAKWFHWSGITPAISQEAATACKEAMEVARKKNITVSGDINYRRNLWQYGKTPLQVMPELISKTDVIVGGTEDFKNCTGVYHEDFETCCELIAKQYSNAKVIATTFRGTENASVQRISASVWKAGNMLSSRTFELNPVVDRIGAGDAFMAGLIFAELHQKSHQQMVDFAAAGCAYKHAVKGDIIRASVNEIEDLVNNQNIGKLLR
jgi:2-dehydro-3-deoxygluconokinase